MAFYSYILRCADGSYYTGHTDDLDARISDGVFQVDFEGGGTFVLSQQVPVRELWLSAFARAWHRPFG